MKVLIFVIGMIVGGAIGFFTAACFRAGGDDHG